LQKKDVPSKKEIASYLRDRRNWGRWKDNPGAGTLNLITETKRVEAASYVRSGKPFSLGRPLPVEPSLDNPRPSDFYIKRLDWIDNGGAALDYFTVFQHGFSVTHIDALCHMWDKHGMWEGKDPDTEISFDRSHFAGVDEMRNGIFTRGVLLDVPRHRGTKYVDIDSPVHGWELEEIATCQNINLTPGDALLIYSGREEYEKANGSYGGLLEENTGYPGLHASCLPFMFDNDISVLLWDMEDLAPNEYGIPWTVHGAIHAYGLAMVDGVVLTQLAAECAKTDTYDFMLTVNPLIIEGGTGSPVNPIAIM
jgi:kynurenine formamidase|tara:strand:+ start:5246 stop:6172 length:927 start_codon:yes stop_codon:yes gene_type:complete